ncbi:zinc finger protein 182-like [Bombyx mandarina]|uniref:Zinc finger protein 182-like n=1 Tax=Bombyx mandarina TaxID=7092 RepID=A0A6J2JSA4_BOMMA|nr:zinc finger protein 182-like [Bombyx mandarina]
MCEWLSYADWCDVKLLCGDRTFEAHRVVLASASTFLREILLSCHTNETPTHMMLPDFDKEAMSAVLHYIYNGEVVLQKQKMDMFLDIVKAMRIYIDYELLNPELGCVQNSSSNSFLKTNACQQSCIISPKSTQCFSGSFVTIKKKSNIKGIQYFLQNFDSHGRQITYQDNRGVQCDNASKDFKSPFVDRQRNSFLRDLFIETYPRNGNVNGQTRSVLAISNECYRSPGSVLLTNANAEHLGAGDIGVQKYKSTVEIPFHSPTCRPEHLRQFTQNQNLMQNYFRTKDAKEIINLRSCYKYSNTVTNTETLPKNMVPMLQTNLQTTYLNDHAPNRNIQNMSSYTQSMADINKCGMSLQKRTILRESSLLISLATDFGNEYCESKTNARTISKAAISNHVLENPWRPRLPVDAKPFRRKFKESSEKLPLLNKVSEAVSDNNNNCATTPAALSIQPPVLKDEFKCNICSQVFLSDDALTTHMSRHSKTARYSCNECGKTFSQLRNFKYHMSIHRGTREFAATCTVCGKYFNDRGYLSSHMKIHRNRKEYKCSQCPKSFNQRVAYNMHVRIHTGVKPHVCDQCGKAFSRKMLLKQHQRTHSGERPYACPHCDKRFADRSNMTLHLRLHTGVKPFSCTLCPKSFTKKHHLKSHLNFHTGSKPYSCPRCKLAFTQSSNMRTHYKKCTVADPNDTSELPPQN